MNNKTTNNLFPQAALYDTSENTDSEIAALQVEKTFARIPENRVSHIGVNGLAMFWLVLLIATVGGLIYSVGDTFSVQHFVNRVVIATDAVVRLGKNLNANLTGSNLPTLSVVSGQLTFIMSGMVLLSVLGLLGSIVARSRKYKNRCRQMQVLEDTVITLRGALLAWAGDIRSTTVELEQATADTERLLTTLLESHVSQSRETAKQLQRLGESVQQMNALVETVQEVAEQINIASLNVSIRAATAGDAGRGFTAIAEQVRQLAEQSGSVANKINEWLANMQQETNAVISFVESTTIEAMWDIESIHQNYPPSVDQSDQQVAHTDEQIGDKQSTSWDAQMAQLAQTLEQIKPLTQKLRHAIDKVNVLAE